MHRRIPLKEFRMQSALEYLTTYGWALLIVAIVAVALFLLAKPTQTQECALPGDFGCVNYAFMANGTLNLTIIQNTHAPIYITAAGCTTQKSTQDMQRVSASPQGLYIPVGVPESFEIECYSKGAPYITSLGSYFNGYVSLNYTDTATSLPNTVFGGITVEATQTGISTTFAPTASPTVPLSYSTLTFTETGLPTGQNWGVTYDGSTLSSTSNTITFTGTDSSPYPFSIQVVTPALTGGCQNIYSPSPASGSTAGGNVESVSFSETSYCYSYLLSDAGGAQVYYLTLDMPSGYTTYLAECGSGAPYISSVTYSITEAAYGGPANTCESGSNSCTDIGYQASPTLSCYTSGYDPWYQSIGSIAINKPLSLATVYTAINGTSADAWKTTLNFNIVQQGSFVILMGSSGWSGSFSPAMPPGCTMDGYLNIGGQTSSFIATCINMPIGSYAIQNTPTSTPAQTVMAAYVFPP